MAEKETVDFEKVWPDLHSIYLFTKGNTDAMQHHLKQLYNLDEDSCVHFTYEAVKRIEQRENDFRHRRRMRRICRIKDD